MFLLRLERAESTLGLGFVGICWGFFFIPPFYEILVYPLQFHIPAHVLPCAAGDSRDAASWLRDPGAPGTLPGASGGGREVARSLKIINHDQPTVLRVS